MILATLLLAQAAPPTPPPTEPIGCAAAAGAVDGTGASLPEAVDGSKLDSVKDITRLRKRARDGRVILVEGGDFSNWDFRKAKLSAICFSGSKLAASKWSGVSAPGMGFIGADLTGAQLADAKLPGVLLRTTTMTGANASDADLSGGQLDGGWSASLAGLRLDGAKLAGFRFRCGVTEADGCAFDRKGITARNTDFSNAVFDGFAFWDANLEGARLEGAEVRLDNTPLLQAAAGGESITVRNGDRRIRVPGRVAAALGRAFAPPPDDGSQMVQAVPQSTRATGGKQLFVSDRLPAVQGGAEDPAWPEAVRALVALAPSYLLVGIEKDGRAMVRGAASDADGARCWIDAGPLAPGAEGSFGVAPPSKGRRRSKPKTAAIIVRTDAAMIAPDQVAAEEAAKVVRCRGNASFGTMKRVPVDDRTFEALWSAVAAPAS